MSNFILKIFIVCFFVIAGTARSREKFSIDERWICTVKVSCSECLKLKHCSWCQTENKCFSDTLPKFKSFCQNSTISHEDYGLSIEENAECACEGGKMKQPCYPSGITEGPECSGRGTCVCGRCACNPNPDPEYPTKTVMGEYCEFDNFSCQGPKCNEGPYSLSQPAVPEEDTSKDTEVDLPEENVA